MHTSCVVMAWPAASVTVPAMLAVSAARAGAAPRIASTRAASSARRGNCTEDSLFAGPWERDPGVKPGGPTFVQLSADRLKVLSDQPTAARQVVARGCRGCAISAP